MFPVQSHQEVMRSCYHRVSECRLYYGLCYHQTDYLQDRDAGGGRVLNSCGVTLTTTISWALYRMDRCYWNSKCAVYMMCNFMTVEPMLTVAWKFVIRQLSYIPRAEKKILILLKMIIRLEHLWCDCGWPQGGNSFYNGWQHRAWTDINRE